MTPVHIHLMLNHLPVFASAIALLLLGYALAREHESYKKLAYVILIAAGLATPMVFLSGERSEEKVEDIAGVSKHALHEHEEAGEAALAVMLTLGAAALLQLLLYAFPNLARLRGKTAFAILLGSALALGWAAWTAKLGGQIRHAEEMGGSAAED
ncbi:MAG: hypothetical protein ABIW76_10235 [Fibrobacteria bacterium]